MLRKLRSIAFLFILFAICAGTAFAAPQPVDLRIMPWQGPAAAMVRSPYQYTVSVKNVGGTSAAGVRISVEFPLTDTSPQRYILGKLTGVTTNFGCQVASNKIQCNNVGNIGINQTKLITFSFELPVSTKTLTFKATATTTTAGEVNTANNTLSHTPVLAYGSHQITSGTVLVSHCTGQGLTSYYECECFPSSISSFVADLNSDLSITHLEYGNIGNWDQFISPQKLHLFLTDGGSSADFNGFNTGSNCFEGMTTFLPASPYVSPYKVCLQ